MSTGVCETPLAIAIFDGLRYAPDASEGIIWGRLAVRQLPSTRVRAKININLSAICSAAAGAGIFITNQAATGKSGAYTRCHDFVSK